MVATITIADLKVVSYLKTEHLGGRTVNLMPLWDGTNWQMWLPTPVGLVKGKVTDTIEGDYVAVAAAKQSDLFIPFVHLMWQRASWPEICPLIRAICDDFHNMGTSVAKLRHFFNHRSGLAHGAATRFAGTEVEYIVILTRTVFDLLQEMISIIWRRWFICMMMLLMLADARSNCPTGSPSLLFSTKRDLRLPMRSKISMDYLENYANNMPIWRPSFFSYETSGTM
jgi:hypothetical protein